MNPDPKDRTYYKVLFFVYLSMASLSIGVMIEKLIKGTLEITDLSFSAIIIPILVTFKTITSYRKWRSKIKEEKDD